MKLYLVRHGLPGLKGYDNRWPGPGLGKTGIQQSQWITKILSVREIHSIIASDFTRTIETARHIQSSFPKAQVETDHRLRERQAEEESHENLVHRVHDWLEENWRIIRSKPCCIVAHGGSLNMILEYLDPNESHFEYPFKDRFGVKTPIAGVWSINLDGQTAELLQCPIQAP